MEAMASGKPVITTMTLDHKLSNYGVKMVSDDINQISESILDFFKMDLIKYNKITLLARKYIEDECSYDAVAKKTLELYNSLTKCCLKSLKENEE
jgi:glycosyltransferase involved in cell wall biosynthesis